MKKSLITALFILMTVGLMWGQFSIENVETTYTQNFNSLTNGAWANNTTLTGWYARTTATASITAYGANSGSTTTAGLYAFGVAGTNPLTDRALGFAPTNAYTGAGGTGKGFIGWRLKNNTGSTVSSIVITWTGEQWRRDNTVVQSLILSYRKATSVTDLISETWTQTSSTFNSPITGNALALDGNTSANRIANITVELNDLNFANGEELMLRWEDLNDSGNDHFLAIDDVSIIASAGSSSLTPPTLTADSNNNNVDNDIDITFTDNYDWRTAITAVKIGGTALTLSTDYTITAGNLQLKPAGGNPLLRTAGTKAVTIVATGYSDASVSQTILAGAASNFTATTVSELLINSTRVVTCTAKDQYDNAVQGYQFKYDVAITNNNATTTESYTVGGTARTVSASGINVTSLTNTSGVTTFSITIPSTVDGGDGISVQVKTADGTTAVGTAKTYYRAQSAPTVTSPTVTSITASSAILGGNITSDGESTITERGTIWKTSDEVTITDNKLPEGGMTTGIFTHSRTSLPANTTIYYRAYAINSIGTTLSTESSFTTPKLEPTSHVSTFTGSLASPQWSSIKLDWTDNSSDGYLIKGSAIGFGDISYPIDGTPEVNSTLVANIANGIGTYTFSGLNVLTTYYFLIFPYTNNGAAIDYRTTATVPQVQIQTIDGPTVIAGWNFENATKRGNITNNATWISNPYTADNGVAANKDLSIISLVGGSTWSQWTTVTSSLHPNAVSWDSGSGVKYWQIAISTSGYSALKLSSKQMSSNTGPRDFKIQYSTNGADWIDTGVNVTAANDNFASGVVNNASLPVACSNQSTLYLRWIMTSTTAVSSANPVASGGTSRIDDILVTGYTYDYPNTIPIAVGASTITVTGGNANNASGSIPTFNNPNFTPSQSLILNLLGTGPWTVAITTTAPWGAYYRNGDWITAQNSGGSITFASINPAKDMNLPIILGDQDPTLPVSLSSFTASISAQNYVNLIWITESETNVNGYYIFRSTDSNLESALMVSPLIRAANSSNQQSYFYTDRELYYSGTYYYWLQNVDFDGDSDFHGPVLIDVNMDGNSGSPAIPLKTSLNGIYPNPFNPNTFINFALAKESAVNIKIYNARGQLIRNLLNANHNAGHHRIQWNGMDDLGNNCGSGIYYFRMQADGKSFTSKGLLMK